MEFRVVDKTELHKGRSESCSRTPLSTCTCSRTMFSEWRTKGPFSFILNDWMWECGTGGVGKDSRVPDWVPWGMGYNLPR